MATDLTQKEASGSTKIVGSDEIYAADVVLEDGLRKLATTKKVQIESLAGVSANANNYLFFQAVSTGDTLRIEIDAAPQTPALNKLFTVQAGENQYTFAARVVLELNLDFTNFQPYFKATQVKDNSIIFLESKIVAEAGENPTQNSFRVTGTGTIAATLARSYDNWVRQTATIQASKSVSDPRIGIFGVEGSVETRSQDVSALFVKQPYRLGVETNIDLNINPANPYSEFTFPMLPLDDIFISEVRIFGLDNGIQFGKFLGNNSALTNGIEVIIKTNNQVVTLPRIKTTEDFADKFAFGGGDGFQLYIQSGGDKFLASFLSSPFPLRRAGTFGVGNDDYIKIRIYDNLTGISQMQSVVVGYLREA